MLNNSLTQLQKSVNSLPEGSIDEKSYLGILELLCNAWDSIQGSEATKLYSWKLDRAENLKKINGKLYFEIERHGGTVNGSTRGIVYTWEVDVDNGMATIIKERNR